ncbi:hypothetical protein [Lentzea sp. NEAU-D7]|uniref:hypothetical protein n=1 Tax=Lentzea sp. NEAU-D7 TaxID=2994667 RepID=UPI00224B0778|nr:hypothetical protein [Lentzea sp. NEAU-D7]MCX2951830.1 hypothetical protein [Lentzea sp. NEAU-D7]
MAASSAIQEVLVAAVPEPSPGLLRLIYLFLVQNPLPAVVIFAGLVIGVWFLVAWAKD